MERVVGSGMAVDASIDEGACEKSPDGAHCVHWWDGDEPCCYCGYNGGQDEEKKYDEGDAL